MKGAQAVSIEADALAPIAILVDKFSGSTLEALVLTLYV